ncbi:MAG: alpha/beta hydrolase, partial [Lysobacterales bacterium]
TLESGYSAFSGAREAGMIAGDRPIGLGWLVGGLDGPGDGTVALDETHTSWLDEHRVLPVTHTGLIYSPRVAELAARFLQTGTFESTGS